ncbi:hypothetical protein DENSPDRAFT_850398 [Dentipellis sp. KUC8613]|nr:hypothetical protein DENSPDRAFT_850398 [Dentipellis sp. KUC8613]
MHRPHPYSHSYIPSLIPPGIDPATVDIKMFQNYIPGAVKTRKRTSPQQLTVLENVFTEDQKPDTALRKHLAEELNMSSREVQVWFQNRRAKAKKTAEKERIASKTESSPCKEEDTNSESEAKPADPPSSPLASRTDAAPGPSPASVQAIAPRPLSNLNTNPALNAPAAWSTPTPQTVLPTRSSFSVSPSTSAAAVPPPALSNLNALRRASLPANVHPASQYPSHHPSMLAGRRFPSSLTANEDAYHRHSVGTLPTHSWGPSPANYPHDARLDLRSYDSADVRRSNRFEPYSNHRPNLAHRASVPAILHATAAGASASHQQLHLTDYHAGDAAPPAMGQWTNPWPTDSFASQNGNPPARTGMGLLPESGYSFGQPSSPDSPGTPALGEYTFPPRSEPVHAHVPKAEEVDPLSVSPFGHRPGPGIQLDGLDGGIIGVEVEQPSPPVDGVDSYGRHPSLQWSESSASTSTSGRGSFGDVHVPGTYAETHPHEFDANANVNADRRGSCVSTSEMFSGMQVSDHRDEYHGAEPYHQASFAASSSSLSVPPTPYEHLDQYGRRGSDQLSPQVMSRRGSSDSSFSHAQPVSYAHAHQDPSNAASASYGSPDHPNNMAHSMVPSFESSELVLALQERTDDSVSNYVTSAQSYSKYAAPPTAQAYAPPPAPPPPAFSTGNNMFGTNYPPQPQSLAPHTYSQADAANGVPYS